MKIKLQKEYLFWINLFARLTGWVVIGAYAWGKIEDPTILLLIILFITIESRMAKDSIEELEHEISP